MKYDSTLRDSSLSKAELDEELKALKTKLTKWSKKQYIDERKNLMKDSYSKSARKLRNRKSLMPLKGKIRTRKIGSFDVETYGDENKFLMGSIVTGIKTQFFISKEEMINEILKLENYWIFATNLDFDFMALFGDHLNKYEVKVCFRNKLLNASVRNKRGRMVSFNDSMNFYPGSVDAMGKIISLPKLAKPEFIGKQPKNKEEFEQLKIYNIRDSEVTFAFMIQFQKWINEIGATLQITISKTALDLFRRKYMKDIWKPVPKNVNDFIRRGYYGGRTEIFYRGTYENMNYYDFNSLYPAQMIKDLPVPDNYQRIMKPELKHIMSYEGFSECVIYCPEMFYPILPYRNPKDGKLIFPCGEFSGVWAHNELRYALESGYKILKISESIIFEQSEKYLSNYAKELYLKRIQYKSEKNTIELAFKLLLNSLYGKFGQRATDFDFISMRSQNIDIDSIVDFYRDDFVKVKVSELKPESNFVYPVISAYITAYGRIELHKIMKENRVLYCDTDSVITDSELPTSQWLGSLKLEKRIKHCILIKPKHYEIEDEKGKIESKIKGINRIRDGDFNIVISGGSLQQMRFMKYKEAIKRDKQPNEKIIFNKKLGLEDTKRLWIGEFDPNVQEVSRPISL